MVRYLIPKDTAALLRGSETLPCEHMGLLLTRYVPLEVIDRSATPDNRYELWRDRWLKAICERFPADTPNLNAMASAMYDRWVVQTDGASRFAMVARSRLIVGLGGKGTLEFGITLQHTTGLPYIPGSALKGLCRNYALLVIAEKQGVPPETEPLEMLDAFLIKPDNPEPDAVLYRQVFGTQGEAGACIFYDALLVSVTPGQSMFTVDVMTPHFAKYYRSGGKDAPDDADQPNPVSFLTLTEGAQFVFAIGQRMSVNGDAPRKQARRWLRDALQELGVGAKTAAGYGVFGPVNDSD